MKKLNFIIVLMLVTFYLSAQEIPQMISYQGKLLENGFPVNGTRSINFIIGSWSELHSSVVLNQGLYSVTLGSASNPIPLSVFDNSINVNLQVIVEGVTLSPQTDILSVAYAYKAEKAVDTEEINGNPVTGNPSTNDVLKWNGSQWTPQDDETGSTGPAGGDLDGSYPDPTVVKIQNKPVSSTSPSNDEVLKWNGSQWTPLADETMEGSTAGGDLSGIYPNPTVDGLQNHPVSSSTPTSGQALKWNGSQWEPADDSDNQTLSINGNDLSISGGNTVPLPGGGITELNQGTGILLSPNPITSTGTISFQNPFNGDFSATNTISTDSPSSSFDGGDIVADDDLIADDDVEVGDNAYIEDVIYINDEANSTGGLEMKGSDGDQVFAFGFSSGTSGKGGALSTYYSGSQRSFLGTISASGNGYGALQLKDHFGQLTIHLNAETGVIAGGSKQFRVVHPQDNTKEIVYTCIEGPEAAAYFRGTTNLINGKSYIEYPEHFNLVINKTTITVNLTPLSAESKGLAVIQKSELGFEVKELFQGKGNYEFDYEVKGVRIGYEDYKVIQDRITPGSVYLPKKEEKGSED